MTGLGVLATPRLRVRPLVAGDAEAARAVLEAPADARFERWLAYAALGPAVLADLLQPPYGERAVVEARTGALVGLVGLVPALGPFAVLDGAPAGAPFTPEVGLFWALRSDARGRGYATEAAGALVAAAFARLRLARIVATTTRDNRASIAVMERLGMAIRESPHPEPAWFQVVGVLERG